MQALGSILVAGTGTGNGVIIFVIIRLRELFAVVYTIDLWECAAGNGAESKYENESFLHDSSFLVFLAVGLFDALETG